MKNYDILIVGGGAAGFFAAINCAEEVPQAKIGILERGKEVLGKVRISGGGRCNVTHAQFMPSELVKNYPRGEIELRGPFHRFMTGDTVSWFEDRGIKLKTEEDGRMFPVSNSSETIIHCFLDQAQKLNIDILKSQTVKDVSKWEEGWQVNTQNDQFRTRKLLMATGSNSKIWVLLQKLGHTFVPPVASLFTFNIQDERIKNLSGIATPVKIMVASSHLKAEGPLLITHWGMSGPAILKLSAWGARELKKKNYHFKISVNWLPEVSSEEIMQELKVLKLEQGKQLVAKNAQFKLPRRLWENLVKAAAIKEGKTWAQANKQELQALVSQLNASKFLVNGKSTFKEEFVTAGGITLKEVNFKTFESKRHKNLFFAGEILNIDAITGGFNFQNAWTGAYIAAKAMAAR